MEPELPNVIIFITLLSFFIILPSLLSQITNGLYFGHDETVSLLVRNSSLDSQLTSTKEKANVYVVWDDNNGIYFTSSQDGGIKFNTKIILSNSNNFSSAPQIATTQKGDVYVVWVDIDNKTGYSNIEFINSNDSGKTFSPQKELRGGKSTSFFPQLAATEKGDVYVVWVDIDNKTGYSNIEFISSNDSGKTFSAQKELRSGKSVSSFPQLTATEKGDVYVVWVDLSNSTGDSNIEFISSNDEGKTFSPKKELRGGDTISFSPQIAATEKGDVYVVWVDKSSKTGDSDITYRSSNDSGRIFDDRKKLRSNSLLSSSPQLAATEKGDVYVVWADKNSTTGDTDISFRSSHDSGRDFHRVINLNKGENKLSNSSLPQIATTAKDSVYVVWADNHIQFKEILAQDALVGNTILLSNITAWSFSPQLTATGKGDVYVVWNDKNNTTDASLHFKRISEYSFDRNS